MSTATIRITPSTHRILRELAEKAGETMQAVLDRAIEAYRRQCFLAEANRAFAALRRDPKAWKAELDERNTWDVATSDLRDEP